jgi:ornithine cyclodeaminase/alanine dehydrogenase-like protein (mu-crystallin family)
VSIATERNADGSPRVLYVSRSDVEAVGGAQSDLYVRALRGALAAHAELGEIVSGRRPGRERDDEIILLNPMGIAVEDIACAAEVYLRAKRQGVGTWLDLY